MNISRYKSEAAVLLDVTLDTPVNELLDLMMERFGLLADRPPSKLGCARLVRSMAKVARDRGLRPKACKP